MVDNERAGCPMKQTPLRRQAVRFLVAVTICTALLVGAESVWTPAFADDQECGESGSISTCLGARNGSINVSSEEGRSTRQGVQPGHQRTGEELANAAFCRDASADA